MKWNELVKNLHSLAAIGKISNMKVSGNFFHKTAKFLIHGKEFKIQQRTVYGSMSTRSYILLNHDPVGLVSDTVEQQLEKVFVYIQRAL